MPNTIPKNVPNAAKLPPVKYITQSPAITEKYHLKLCLKRFFIIFVINYSIKLSCPT